jgi:hypothetical protein
MANSTYLRANWLWREKRRFPLGYSESQSNHLLGVSSRSVGMCQQRHVALQVVDGSAWQQQVKWRFSHLLSRCQVYKHYLIPFFLIKLGQLQLQKRSRLRCHRQQWRRGMGLCLGALSIHRLVQRKRNAPQRSQLLKQSGSSQHVRCFLNGNFRYWPSFYYF